MPSPPLFARLRTALKYVRLRSFDLSTEAGRAAERTRRITLSALASAAARAISISASLVTVPLTLHYLGAERFGMWMAMSAFTAMFSFADLGIGNGILTAVSNAHGRGDLPQVQRYVSSAFFLLGAICLLVLALLALCYPFVPWATFFNVSSPIARSEAAPAIAVFIACFAVSIPLGIAQRVQIGMQMGFMASLWQCLASAIGLCGILCVIWLKAGLPWLVLAYAGAPVLVAAVNSFLFFVRIKPDFSPKFQAVSRSHGSELARTGFLFFALQLAAAVTYTSDNLVIAHALGASQVAHYSVPDRLFAMASMIVSLAITPLWPAFGESLARGDHGWARRTLIRATLLSACIAAVICLIFIFIGPSLIKLWVGTAIHAPLMLLLGLAVWRTTEATAGAASMFLNALRIIKFQIAIALTTALVAIALKIYLVPRFGAPVIPWITTAAFIVFAGIPTAWMLRKRLREGIGHSGARVAK